LVVVFGGGLTAKPEFWANKLATRVFGLLAALTLLNVGRLF